MKLIVIVPFYLDHFCNDDANPTKCYEHMYIHFCSNDLCSYVFVLY